MNYDELRAIILANPTEPPTSIAERIDVPAWRVKDARTGLIAIGAVPRLAKVNGPITDADCAAIIEMRRAGHSITAIKDHFRRSYSVVFRIIAAATRAGQIDPAKRIVPIKPAQAAIKAGELQPVKRMRREERKTCRGGLGDAPAPKVRLGLNATDCERSAIASLRQSGHRGTELELLNVYRGFVARKARSHASDMPA
jgi:hypothetical protein